MQTFQMSLPPAMSNAQRLLLARSSRLPLDVARDESRSSLAPITGHSSRRFGQRCDELWPPIESSPLLASLHLSELARDVMPSA